ncbi:unnamed protein product [Closterium sp. NIES-54]
MGEESFSASLLDLPAVVESWKTYDDNSLVKTADVGQMIVVREPSEAERPIEGPESRNGLTPPMRDVRRRRFRREPDLNVSCCMHFVVHLLLHRALAFSSMASPGP